MPWRQQRGGDSLTVSRNAEDGFSTQSRAAVVLAALVASSLYMLAVKGSQRPDGTYAYSSVPVVLMAGEQRKAFYV